MTIILDGTTGITSPNDSTGNQSYTGTLTGGTGIVNLGSGQFYKDASGNVGVGTASPRVKLDVTAGEAIISNGTSNTASTGGTLWLNTGVAGLTRTAGIQAITTTTDNGHSLLFYTNAGSSSPTERMRIDSSGNVGIGTSSPATKLDVTGSVNSLQARFGNVAGRGLEISTAINVGVNDATSVLNAKGANSGIMTFQTDSTERMRIDSSGNVGIGMVPNTWSANRKALQIGGNTVASLSLSSGISEIGFNTYVAPGGFTYSTSNYAGLITFNNTTVGGFSFGVAPSGTAGNAATITEAMRIYSSGDVTIGTNSPTGKLTVYGQVTGGFGVNATTGATADWNNVAQARSGNGTQLLLGTATNGPGPNAYYFPFSFEYSAYDGSGNLCQMAYAYLGPELYMRNRYNGTWGAWVKIG
jgi:hypothetical protein